MAGISYSNATGDKSQPNWDTACVWPDYWVVKIDASGNKQWDKRFGGLSEDVAAAIVQTEDGGYVVAGTTSSGISGDKTQPNRGGYDYWAVRMDANGNKLWDKRFGGTRDDLATDICTTKDGGFILEAIKHRITTIRVMALPIIG